MRDLTAWRAGLVALAFLGAGGSALPAQTVERQTLGEPDATFPEPFSQVAGLRELSDGRVLIADPIELVISRVDLRSGRLERVGRQGQGPGEYQMPGVLLALPGDTTLMLDGVNRRMSIILPSGQISHETIALRHPAGWPIFPRGVDARGRIYFDLGGMMMPGLEEMGAQGIAPLLRWDRSADVLDTLGYVHFPPMEPVGPGEMVVRIGGGAYEGRDAWAVTPDGKVAVARYREYRVEWLSGAGPPVIGETVAYEPVKITRADKEAWADRMASRGLMIEVENGRRRTMRPPRPDIDRMHWPEEMPPFLGAGLGGGVRVTPEGEAWVERARPARERQRTYDVFDRRGRLVRQVVLPQDRRLVGFGHGVLYAVRVDSDDLEWLERYRR